MEPIARIARAVVETLEGRRLLSAFHAPGAGIPRVILRRDDDVRVAFFGGNLTIVGTHDADNIVVAATDDNEVVVNGEILTHRGRNLHASLVRRVVVHARGGNDEVNLGPMNAGDGFTRLVGTVVYAGDGDDRVTGSPRRDVVFGGRGADYVTGGDGDDVLYGQQDWDRLEGDAGDDRLIAGDGDFNILYGGAGDDLLQGGADRDDLYAAGYGGYIEDEGHDTLVGAGGTDRYLWATSGTGHYTVREAGRNEGDDEDTLWLGAGNFGGGINIDLTSETRRPLGDGSIQIFGARNIEQLFGSPGPDHLVGNALDNYIDGGYGDDVVDGGDGDDFLADWEGNDRLLGGLGDDTLSLNPGNDELDGGAGNDTYSAVGAYPFGSDRITEAPDADVDTLDFRGGAGGVVLDLGAIGPQQVLPHLSLSFANGREIENVFLNSNESFKNWHHRVTGNARDNLIVGGINADTLDGAGGDDTLVGGGGQDVLIGGEGEDAFDAEDGETDDLHGGPDEDSILTKDDADVLHDIP